MIVITVRFKVLHDRSRDWLALVSDFTRETRSEPGNLWFDWSVGIEDPDEYILLEAFRDGEAAGKHVNSDHFKTAMKDLPDALAETPRIINFEIPGDDWSRMGEMEVPPAD